MKNTSNHLLTLLRNKVSIKIIWSCFLATFISCAGPTSPFGAKDVLSIVTKKSSSNRLRITNGQSSSYSSSRDSKIYEINRDLEFVSVKFSPGTQIWHNKFDLKIEVRDELGLQSDSKLILYYNQQPISESQSKYLKKDFHSDGKGVTYTFEDFRLPVLNDHQISAIFWRSKNSPPQIGFFEEPTCTLREQVRSIASMGSFKRYYSTFQKIKAVALAEKVNPNFLAAIVAQESSFDPNAVSWAKAIGLTQVTPIAAKQIQQSKKISWPLHPEANSLSYLELKMAIHTGHLNETNDWRLNTDLSLEGAIHYFDYLENYWKKAQKKAQIEIQRDELANLILASYHSGAARVKNIYLQDSSKGKKNWSHHENLGEARKYFRKIRSYCYHFENAHKI